MNDWSTKGDPTVDLATAASTAVGEARLPARRVAMTRGHVMLLLAVSASLASIADAAVRRLAPLEPAPSPATLSDEPEPKRARRKPRRPATAERRRRRRR